MITKPIPDSDLGMYVSAETPEKDQNGEFKFPATKDKGTYRYTISTKLSNLSLSNGIRKAKAKIQADRRKEFEAALKLPNTKSLGTYNHDESKCHVLNPEMDPNVTDEEYNQMRRETDKEKQKQQKEKATKSCCDSGSSCQDCPSSAERVLGGDEVCILSTYHSILI